MKKVFSLFLFILVLLFVYSCNLQMPTAVEIRATPELEFSASFNFSDYFEEMINFEGKENIYYCTKTEDLTYLFYTVLSEGTDNEFVELKDILPGIQYTEIELYNSKKNNSPIIIPAPDEDEGLRDFRFTKTESRLYISGSKISKRLTIEIWINDDDGNAETFNGIDDKFNDDLLDRYNFNFEGLELPPNGGKIENLDFNGEVEVNFRIFIAIGEDIETGDINDPFNIKVELATWLPFMLEAVKEGAEIKLPQDLFSEGDLFGRESADDDSIIESLHFSIGLNKNPFTDATLVITSGDDIRFENPTSPTAIGFPITETMMQTINRSFPFSPKLSLRFKQGGRMSIPRNFHTTGVYFKARINYRIDL